MKYVQEIDDQASLRALIILDLKEFGVKVPKSKKNKVKDDGGVDAGFKVGVFGTSLANVPSIILEEYGAVPKFLVEATQVIERHVGTEGLFRKSGSLARQKELRQCIEAGGDLVPTAHPFDVTSLVKQFFRELPDPLLTFRLHDTFLRCFSVESEQVRHMSLLLTCHLLPAAHMSTLRFMMHFLQCVAAHADSNKMDLQNLAVCMAPNLLYAPGKGDRAMAAESRLLQQETGIIQLLMERADALGMVSDSLCQRTSLMTSCCFPSDDELEKSEFDDNRVNKKKKRSGSFQGLVSNLSSSFSRWRRDCKGHNNSNMSDKSSMSYMMSERSSFVTNGDDSPVTLPYDAYDSVFDTQPKLVRKRKAEEDTVPFSASKKKAILQNMPHMSTLGNTPFTPAIRKARPEEFQDTPQISFADDSHATFSATPRLKMEPLLLSPTSTSKCKRNNSSRYGNQSKSSCFSPKTPKSGVKKTVRGFFRRLSGSKDPQSSHNMSDLSQRSDDTGVGLGREGGTLRRGEGGIVIIEPPSESRKKGLFRRHPKTPSSPARLVTSVSADHSDWSANSSHMTSTDRAEESVSDSQLDPSSSRHHHRCYSGDTSLRRGRPNTIKSGLPSPRHKRMSIEQDPTYCKDVSKRSATFVSPVKCEMFDCGPGTFDTSPIPSIAPDTVTSDNGLPTEAATTSMTPQTDAEQRVDNITMEIDESSSNVDQLPLDHDNAFIQDSILCAETVPMVALEMTGLETSPEVDNAETTREDPVPVVDVAMMQVDAAPSADNTENVATWDALSSPRQEGNADNTVGSGRDDLSGPRLTAVTSLTYLTTDNDNDVRLSPARAEGSNNTAPLTLHTRVSDASLDSAVCLSSDTASIDSVMCQSSDTTSIDSVVCPTSDTASIDLSVADASLNALLVGDSRDKSQSTGSVTSCDSGIGLGSVQQGHVKPCSVQCGDTVQLVVHTQHSAKHQPEVSTAKDNLPQSLLHQEDQGTKTHSVAKHANQCPPESDDRHWSPLRFPSSPLRRPRRGTSPVRIPTIFAKADQEANRYRELAKSVLRSGASSRHSRQPSLPISTNLLRSHAVEAARCRLALAEGSSGGKTTSYVDTLAGHTPLRVSKNTGEAQLGSEEFSLRIPLRESNSLYRDECTGVTSKTLTPDELASTTPRIKPPLLAGSQKMVTPGVSMATPHRRCHSPVKPVKRLQGSCSPSSPHSRYGRSPRRYKKSPVKPTTAYGPGSAPSSLPAHVIDWNV